MTDDRDLLFTDICARLKYNVKVRYKCFHVHSVQGLTSNGLIVLRDETDKLITTDIKNIKPYLLPMSSMTEEQKKEYCSLVWFDGLSSGWDRDDAVVLSEVEMLIDFYHKNHLDWRGLIEKGLAIDATGLNIY